MKKRYEFSFDDYVNCQMYIYAKSKNYKNNKILIYIYSVVFIVFGIFLLTYERNYIFAIFAFLFVIYLVFLRPKIIKRANEKHFKDIFRITGMDASRDFSIELNEDSMTLLSNTSDSHIKMFHTDIFEIDEVKDAFYVRFNFGLAFIFCKRDIECENLREYFIDLANSLNVKYIDDSKWKQ